MDIKICDICKDRNKDAETHRFTVGFERNPIGEREDDVKYVDLCESCLYKLYRAAFEHVTEKGNPISNNLERGKIMYKLFELKKNLVRKLRK